MSGVVIVWYPTATSFSVTYGGKDKPEDAIERAEVITMDPLFCQIEYQNGITADIHGGTMIILNDNIKKASKITAILSGGDWNDAGVDHVELPANCDVSAAHTDYKRWYKEVYHDISNNVEHQTFIEWLKNYHSAKDPAEGDVEMFWEDI